MLTMLSMLGSTNDLVCSLHHPTGRGAPGYSHSQPRSDMDGGDRTDLGDTWCAWLQRVTEFFRGAIPVNPFRDLKRIIYLEPKS